MERVLTLIDQKSNKADYEQAKKDLQEFKKVAADAAPAEGQQQQATDAATLDQNGNDTQPLSLPTPPTATFEPKIELPESASPEATFQPGTRN